jgi:hypothetical protein
MSRHGYGVPSRRYLQFITAFEKAVEEAQEQIKKIETMEFPYNTVKLALDEANIPNDTTLRLKLDGVTITTHALPTDSIKIFDDLSTKIGESLKHARLHSTGVPCCSMGGSFLQVQHKWYGKNIKDSKITYVISFDIIIPKEGLIDLKVEEVPYTHTYTGVEYSLTRTKEKTILEDLYKGKFYV